MIIKAWRANTGFRLPANKTVMDVVRHEIEELGNDIGFDEQNIPLCESLPWFRCMWVAFSKKNAERYGDPERIALKDPIIIGDDGEGGYLVVTDTRPAPQAPTSTIQARIMPLGLRRF